MSVDPPPINFWMPELIFMKFGIYIYYDIWIHLNGIFHKTLLSVCVPVCVSLLSLLGKGSVKCIRSWVARQRVGKDVPAARNVRKIEDLLTCVFVSLCIPLWLLGNNSVKTFPRQRRIVGGFIFHEAPVVSNKSRRYSSPEILLYDDVFIVHFRTFLPACII
jgi:hypothetical protein